MKYRYVLPLASALFGSLLASGIAAAHWDGPWRGRSTDRGFGLDRFCQHRHGAEWQDHASAAIERELKLSEPQIVARRRVVATMHDAEPSFAALCEREKTAANAALARFENLMMTGLDAVRRVRPPFEAFYASLDENQRKEFDELFASRRRR